MRAQQEKAATVQLPAAVDADISGDHVGAKLGTQEDQAAMRRVGKKQELRRGFRFLSILCYAVVIGGVWDFVLMVIDLVLSLPDGGTAGTVYMFIIACTGMFLVTLSLAEMGSMAPTAGGQFFWTSEFAPPNLQKPLSYLVGFFCVLGWQTILATCCLVGAQLLEAIIVLAKDSYTPVGWHTTLLTWAVLAMGLLMNTVGFVALPALELVAMVGYVLGFLAFVVVLWVTAPKASVAVLTTFSTDGWSSTGLACLIGLNAAVADLIGFDAVVHVSEELQEASWALPRAMVLTAIVNDILGFITVITLVFCLGNVGKAETSKTGQPIVEIVLNATQSTGATITLTAVLFVMIAITAINDVTTCSRQLWAFARDGGPPFSRWISHVNVYWDVPINAMMVSVVIVLVLSSIAIGSTITYDVLVTLGISGLLSSYAIPIACILRKRLCREALPPSKFDLGRAGSAINIAALLFLVVAFVFQFFPDSPDPSPAAMNWSVLISGCCVIFFGIYYTLRARHRYVAPVELVMKGQ